MASFSHKIETQMLCVVFYLCFLIMLRKVHQISVTGDKRNIKLYGIMSRTGKKGWINGK